MNIGFFKNVLDKVSFSKPQRIFHQSKLEFFLYASSAFTKDTNSTFFAFCTNGQKFG